MEEQLNPVPEIKRTVIEKFFIREYDELGIFVISISLLLCALINQNFQSDIIELSKTQAIFFLFFIFSVCGFGIVLSFYHVFSKAKKDTVDKHIMIFFAISIQALTAFVGFNFAFNNQEISIVFPSLNTLYAYVSIRLFFDGKYKPEDFKDDESLIADVVIAVILTITVIGATTFLTNLHWIEILSAAILFGNQIGSSSHAIKARLVRKI